MLTVGIEKDHPRDFSTDPLSQSGLDCLAFAAVLIVNNHFGAGFARALCSLIARAVINHKNVVKSLAGPPDNVADVFFVLVRRNNRGCLRSYFCHVERSRLPSRSFMRRLETSQYLLQRFDSLTSRSLNLRSSRLCRCFPSRSILD